MKQCDQTDSKPTSGFGQFFFFKSYCHTNKTKLNMVVTGEKMIQLNQTFEEMKKIYDGLVHSIISLIQSNCQRTN